MAIRYSPSTSVSLDGIAFCNIVEGYGYTVESYGSTAWPYDINTEEVFPNGVDSYSNMVEEFGINVWPYSFTDEGFDNTVEVYGNMVEVYSSTI